VKSDSQLLGKICVIVVPTHLDFSRSKNFQRLTNCRANLRLVAITVIELDSSHQYQYVIQFFGDDIVRRSRVQESVSGECMGRLLERDRPQSVFEIRVS
jgi:hypothetical protein